MILHLYKEMGDACVDALNGDFAFAIFDRPRRQLFMARDRMGVRPLYYAHVRGRLFFASEIKALLDVPGFQPELDPKAIDEIFTFWFPLAPRTAFKGVFELPPGHLLVATPDRVEIKRYWQLDFPRRGEGGYRDDGEDVIAEELKSLLTDATRIRLRSDVPVGAYLSGGLDSSTIAALTKEISPARLQTFSVTFDSEEFDESSHQMDMVRALDTRHESVGCSAADIGAMFPDVIRHVERPILRTAPAPLFKLSDLVRRRGFKVVLTGEGADEVFAGYDIFKEAKVRAFCARQPSSRMRPALLRRLYPYLPGLKGQSQSYLSAFFGAGLGDIDDPLFSHRPRFETRARTKAFFSGELRASLAGYDALAALRDDLPADFARWDPLCQSQYLESAYLLPGYILSAQGDRVAMAHGVEGRFPFLDHRLVEFAARIPPKLKLKVLREKHILRRSAEGLLPQTINQRPKQPYRAPDSQSFFGPGAPDYVPELIASRELAEAGHFNPKAVDKLARKCATQSFVGFRDNMALVGIVSTQLWHREFIGRARAQPMPREAAVA